MKKFMILAAMAMLVGGASAAVRDTISLNAGWQFHLGELSGIEAVKNAKSERVNLPHDFLIGQPWVEPDASERPENSDAGSNVRSRLSPRGFKEMGIGWYRYELTPKAEWKGKRIVLDFQGIMLVGDVYLNGKRIGGTDYGYLGFDIDLSKLLKWGQVNEIIVKADTGKPNNSRWYTGGGLFRDVNLIVTDKNLYFPRHPLFIRTENNKKVKIQAEIACFNKVDNIPAEVKIYDANGEVVAQKKQNIVFNGKWRTREYELQTIEIDNANLWSCASPYLYTAEVTLFDNQGNVVDQIREQFGVRTIEFSPDFGFKLNGKKVLLKGYANHHTLGALGAAAYPRAIEKRIQLMKSFGYNHIRTSHNPYSEDFMRLCDRYGILVVDELYDKWLTQYAGGRVEWEAMWQRDIPEWVKRDRNHPCVVLWSLGNELQTHPDLPYNDWGVTPYKMQRELLHRYDTTRPITVAMHPRGRSLETDSIPAPLALITDIAAYNYRYMYFPGDSRRFPNMIFYQSEASTAALPANFFGMNREQVIGLAYWGGIDYLGESGGWPAKGWAQGVFDISLEPPPIAYLMKCMFTHTPTVHIGVIKQLSKDNVWNGINVGTEKMDENWNLTPGQKISLNIYTNAEEVELFVNGKSLGTRQNPKEPNSRDKIRWDSITYQPGSIEAVAKTNGRIVARHRLETTGEAVKLMIQPDTEIWHADGMDLMHLRIVAVDKKGRRVQRASDKLKFSIHGNAEIIAVCNGDITSDESFVGNERSLYDGSALVILRSMTKTGKITFTVTGDKLKSTNIKLQTK